MRGGAWEGGDGPLEAVGQHPGVAASTTAGGSLDAQGPGPLVQGEELGLWGGQAACSGPAVPWSPMLMPILRCSQLQLASGPWHWGPLPASCPVRLSEPVEAAPPEFQLCGVCFGPHFLTAGPAGSQRGICPGACVIETGVWRTAGSQGPSGAALQVGCMLDTHSILPSICPCCVHPARPGGSGVCGWVLLRSPGYGAGGLASRLRPGPERGRSLAPRLSLPINKRFPSSSLRSRRCLLAVPALCAHALPWRWAIQRPGTSRLPSSPGGLGRG